MGGLLLLLLWQTVEKLQLSSFQFYSITGIPQISIPIVSIYH